MSVCDALAQALGHDQVLTDPAVTRSFGTDWTGRWAALPVAVVRPTSTEQVSTVLRICAEAGTPVVPQGGNTGLVGGSVPVGSDAVVLSTTRLTALRPVDTAARQVTVGAGVTIARLHAHVAPSGLTYGVDLASRDSATVGGTVATNAGGVRVVRFGDTRAQVLGVEAVFADGSVMSRLDGLPKDSAGPDLSSLLVGSEGTLAVVTAVRVRLRPALPAGRVTTLVGVPSVRAAVELLGRTGRDGLLAAEYLDNSGMQLVCKVAGLPHPLRDRWPYYLLLETAGEPPLDADTDAVVDRRLWEYRERQPEAAATLGTVHSLDVALPAAELGGFLDGLPALVAPFRVFTFGHLAEGNVHVQLVGPGADDRHVDDLVLQQVAGLGGSISSEHGVGRAKAHRLHLCRDAAHRQVLARVKDALDPRGVLNPGVLLESRGSAAEASR